MATSTALGWLVASLFVWFGVLGLCYQLTHARPARFYNNVELTRARMLCESGIPPGRRGRIVRLETREPRCLKSLGAVDVSTLCRRWGECADCCVREAKEALARAMCLR